MRYSIHVSSVKKIMNTKKYRFLLLISILFSFYPLHSELSLRDREIINKLAKDSLLMYAMMHRIPQKRHLKWITEHTFGKSNVALEILTKKIMRHVCKQLYVRGYPLLTLHSEALKRFEKYQKPSRSKQQTTRINNLNNSRKRGMLSNLSKFTIIIVALLLVFMALTALLNEKTDSENREVEFKKFYDDVSEKFPLLSDTVSTLKEQIDLIKRKMEILNSNQGLLEEKINELLKKQATTSSRK